MLTVDDIITRIADLTDSKGWTMIRLCKESNIPYGVFNRFLKGDKMISINNLQKSAKHSILLYRNSSLLNNHYLIW